MAVTLELQDFLLPEGELDPALFPSRDLSSLIDGWLTQAIGKVETNSGIADHNGAAYAWVNYRAFSLKAQDAMRTGSTMRVGPVSKSTSDTDQRGYWQKLADKWLSTYNGYDASLVAATAAATSHSLNNVAVW